MMANALAAAEIYSARHHDYVVRELLEFTAEYPGRSAVPWEEMWGVQGYVLPRVSGNSRAPAQVHVPTAARAPVSVRAPAQRSAQTQGSAQAQANAYTSDPWAALGDKRRAAVTESNEKDAAQLGGMKQQSTGVTAESSRNQEKAKGT
ncbi:hypothetical protein N7G274_001006 [Stereocaulon virgatum]|uniref:Uncharacterized protein n=1 Tax=Stereocaulon virgatum TaxID=373712 RepID=A0ABR4AU43_9LECA